MRQKLAVLVVVAVGVAAPAVAIATAAHASAAVAVKTCSVGYVSANLSWGAKCLRAGEFCKVGNREYAHYGFVCPASGHLARR